jgi:hypothetical protein
LISERRPCDAALSLAERIEINLAEALSRSSSIGTFWAISVNPRKLYLRDLTRPVRANQLTVLAENKAGLAPLGG